MAEVNGFLLLTPFKVGRKIPSIYLRTSVLSLGYQSARSYLRRQEHLSSLWWSKSQGLTLAVAVAHWVLWLCQTSNP